MTPLVEGISLAFSYGARPVLAGVDFAVQPGELVALVGPNGAGKSTLLQVLLGWLRPGGGEVRLGDRPSTEFSRAEIARRLAFVPQSASVDLAFTVRELVAMGRTPHLGRFRPEGPADVAAIERALDATGTRTFADRPVSELSGGERQRAHLARAFAQEAGALLLDEPTANLDLQHQLEVLDLVRAFAKSGKGAAIAIHDLGLAGRYADRVVVLAEGRIAASGTPGEVLTEDLLTRHFRVRARVQKDPADGHVVIVPLAPLG